MNRYCINRNSEHGTALFMALLIVAIVAAIAVTLTRFQRIDVKRTEMLLTSEQSYLYAQAASGWAVDRLASDLDGSAPVEVWPVVLSSSPIADGQGSISAVLSDAESFFNINNFTIISSAGSGNQQASANLYGIPAKKSAASHSVARYEKVFSNLLNSLGIQLAKDQQKALIAAIKDWVDQKSQSTQFGQVYAQRVPAYQSPHSPMVSVSELRLVAGMTAEIYSQLLPYIIALPENTNINLKHAPSILAQAAAEGANERSGIKSKEDKSGKYFLLRTDVVLREQHLVLYTLFKRRVKNEKLAIKILWQSMGTM